MNIGISYPGNSPQVVADTVSAPIEQQVNGVEGMLYMSSQSGNDGTYSLTVTFDMFTPGGAIRGSRCNRREKSEIPPIKVMTTDSTVREDGAVDKESGGMRTTSTPLFSRLGMDRAWLGWPPAGWRRIARQATALAFALISVSAGTCCIKPRRPNRLA